MILLKPNSPATALKTCLPGFTTPQVHGSLTNNKVMSRVSFPWGILLASTNPHSNFDYLGYWILREWSLLTLNTRMVNSKWSNLFETILELRFHTWILLWMLSRLFTELRNRFPWWKLVPSYPKSPLKAPRVYSN